MDINGYIYIYIFFSNGKLYAVYDMPPDIFVYRVFKIDRQLFVP